jgi:hypothetical protein
MICLMTLDHFSDLHDVCDRPSGCMGRFVCGTPTAAFLAQLSGFLPRVFIALT